MNSSTTSFLYCAVSGALHWLLLATFHIMSISSIYDRIRTVAHFYGISSLAHEPFQKVVPEWRPSQLFCVVHAILTGRFLDMNETLEDQWLQCMKLIPQIWTRGIVNLPAFEYVQCLCLSWLFPTTSSWGRCNRYVISFAAFFDFALGFCTLSRRSMLTPGAKRSHEHIVLLSRFLDKPLQVAFLLDRTCWHGVVTAWLNHILYLAWRPEHDNDDVGFTYLGGISCKHRCFYVGYCGLLRKNAQHRFGLFNVGSTTKSVKRGPNMAMRKDTNVGGIELPCTETISCQFFLVQNLMLGNVSSSSLGLSLCLFRVGGETVLTSRHSINVPIHLFKDGTGQKYLQSRLVR